LLELKTSGKRILMWWTMWFTKTTGLWAAMKKRFHKQEEALSETKWMVLQKRKVTVESKEKSW